MKKQNKKQKNKQKTKKNPLVYIKRDLSYVGQLLDKLKRITLFRIVFVRWAALS